CSAGGFVGGRVAWVRWGGPKGQGGGFWPLYWEVQTLPPQPRSDEAGHEIRLEALLGQREPTPGGGDRAVPFPAGERRRDLALLRRRGLRPGRRKRPGHGRLRRSADLPAVERQSDGATTGCLRAHAVVGA